MSKDEPLVSVVIVNWNGIDDTKECLDHLGNQTYQNIEIIVVDNGSTDSSVKMLDEMKGITLVSNSKNLGFTGGHIAGYKASKGKFILLLNNDAIMDKSYIEQAVKYIEADEYIGALGGRAYLWDDDNPLFDTSNKFYGYQNINPITGEGIFTTTDSGYPAEVNNVSGSCVMVSRKVIEKTGYLHDPFFAYYEESDLFARMKRSGYKVIYHPALAIWHANAKTSSKKAPTFSLYMMMRNRFRFAVRNFDKWSLLRFMKFYLIMGSASFVRSVTDKSQRPMHQAYAKAFIYNMVHWPLAFVERRKLTRQFGPSDYNRTIVAEQSPVSIITVPGVGIHSELIEFANNLDGYNELAVSSKNKQVISHIKHRPHIHYCLNKDFLSADDFKMAAVVSRNDWLILSKDNGLPSIDEVQEYRRHIYDMRKNGKKMAAFSKTNEILSSVENVWSFNCSSTILIAKSEFLDAGRSIEDLNSSDSMRSLILFAYINSTFASFKYSYDNELSDYNGPVESMTRNTERVESLINSLHSDKESNTKMSRLAARYYRIAQTRNLVVWLLSSNITIRLKLARIKNLALTVLTFNRINLATELRHIKNEVYGAGYIKNIGLLNKYYSERLRYMSEQPNETVVFIIVRDRLEIMAKLLKWLESVGLSKIVFFDNDSIFPPMTKFLDETGFQVLYMGKNTKQTGLWDEGAIKLLLDDDYYIVTDPDIVPVRENIDVVSRLYELHGEFPYHLKVGLGLKIDDLPDHYPLKSQVVKWESQFWKTELQKGVFEAGVDTTFALYKPGTFSYTLHPSIRTGDPYTARHLPWYQQPKKLSEEEIFYRYRMDQNVSSWNLDELPERYKEEFKNLKGK